MKTSELSGAALDWAVSVIVEARHERIKTLEQRVEMMETKPRMSLAQKLRARGEK